MAYITKEEVSFSITDDDLEIITETDDKIFYDVLSQSEEEVKGYLRQRYDIDQEMRDIVSVDSLIVDNDFNVGDRFYYLSNVYEAIAEGGSGESLENTDFFIKHDSRNPKLKQVVVYVLLYHISARMTPRNVPEIRHILYNGNNDENDQSSALFWLRGVRDSKMDLNLPLKLNSDGETNNKLFRYGNSPSIDTVY